MLKFATWPAFPGPCGKARLQRSIFCGSIHEVVTDFSQVKSDEFVFKDKKISPLCTYYLAYDQREEPWDPAYSSKDILCTNHTELW